MPFLGRSFLKPSLVAIFVSILVGFANGAGSNKTNKNLPDSSGTILSLFMNGGSEVKRYHGSIHSNRLQGKKLRTTIKPKTTTTKPLFGDVFQDNLSFLYKTGSVASDHSNSLRTFLFPTLLSDAQTEAGIRLAGSFLHYMGRVQVALPHNKWGSICGEGWDIRDATVACRQLGFSVAGVIPRPRMEFGRRTGPVVMKRVKCQGHESSLDDCPAERWDGVNTLPCRTQMSAAGLVCGCALNPPPKVRSRCFLFTSFPYDTLYCRHSCSRSQVLLGDVVRHCGRQQQWSGLKPQCIEIAPAVPRPLCRISTTNRIPCLRRNIQETAILKSFSSRRLLAEKCISYGCCYDHSAGTEEARCFIPADSPCVSNPCLNGGICKDYFREKNNYDCACPAPFGGKNCEFERDWSCGHVNVQPDLRPVRPQLRIVGGRRVRRGSWPWIVQYRDNREHFCSGTLIAPQWVLTAAHCLNLTNLPNGPNNNTRWTILIGQHSRLGLDATTQRLEIEHVVTHNYTNYNNDIPRNDIALLKLRKPVKITNYSSPICLPHSRSESPSPETKCWIAGWGKTTVSGRKPEVMQQGDIPILSTEKCRQYADPARSYNLVEDSMICAGYEEGGIDACKGDSGSPLMCSRKDGSWYAAGIVSWGYGCAAPLSPGVYTKVSHFLGWIYDTIHNI